MKTLLVHGPSGCGKDTQLDLLQEVMDFERISTGDMFRGMKKEGGGKYQDLIDLMDAGGLPNTKQTYEILENYVGKFDNTKNWFFVSVVRRENQMASFDHLLSKVGRKLDLFVHFTIDDDTAVERLSLRSFCPKCSTTYHEIYKQEDKKGYCNVDGEKLVRREDDSPEGVRKRLSWYNDNIQSILDEYRNRGILLEIDASPGIEDIQKELRVQLKDRGIL